MSLSVRKIDISILEYNLLLSYEDRLLQHQNALELVLELEKVHKVLYAKPESIAQGSNSK